MESEIWNLKFELEILFCDRRTVTIRFLVAIAIKFSNKLMSITVFVFSAIITFEHCLKIKKFI
ncbi:MAG: hypothetical protein COX07_04185 [Bacteroidetes bacterium CG23_combo_of_CG06-09_8_20_14_all_32_9]|nr:MAG: hypothetical protein COX07_04185 [Bacteroidetes bacterium CG23_combo_of_CG06-09_8_20_14_all_32_9]